MFDIRGDKVVLDPEDLAYEPFKSIYNNAKDKILAQKYIEYIVWMNKPTSRYVKAYPPSDRERTVKLDVFGSADYKLPAEMPDWVLKYNELSQTTASRLLKSARNKIEDLIKFFGESSNLDTADALKIVSALSKVGPLTESLKKLEIEVMLEENTNANVRGGYDIGKYEVPRNK